MLNLKDISTLTYTEDGVTYTAQQAQYSERFKMHTCRGCDFYDEDTVDCDRQHDSQCSNLGVIWKKPENKTATYYYIEDNMKFISKPAVRNSCMGCYFADEDDCSERANESKCVERDVVWLKVDHFHPPMHDYVVSSVHAPKSTLACDGGVPSTTNCSVPFGEQESDYYVLDIRNHYLDWGADCNSSDFPDDYWNNEVGSDIPSSIRMPDVDSSVCSVGNGNNSTGVNKMSEPVTFTYTQNGKTYVGMPAGVKYTNCNGCYFNSVNALSELESTMACERSECEDHHVIWKLNEETPVMTTQNKEQSMNQLTYTEDGEDFVGVEETSIFSCNGCYFQESDCNRCHISGCSENFVIWKKVENPTTPELKSKQQQPVSTQSVGEVSITYTKDGVTYNGVSQEGKCVGCHFVSQDGYDCYANTKCDTFNVIWKLADDKTVDQNNKKDKQIEQKDMIIEQLREMLLQRSQTGIKKYGTTLERTDLTSSEWCQHVLEELLDASGYILRLKSDLQALGK